METRYVLKEEVDNKAPAEIPYLYTYDEVKEWINQNYGIIFEETDNQEIIKGQGIVIEQLIDDNFVVIDNDESYSWYESMCEYDFTDEWD